MPTDIYPMTFEPIYRHADWGADLLDQVYERGAGKISESIELIDKDGMSAVAQSFPFRLSLLPRVFPWACRSFRNRQRGITDRAVKYGISPAVRNLRKLRLK